MSHRLQKINAIQNRLEGFYQEKPCFEYQAEALLDFFRATKNIFSYFYWLVVRAPKLDPKKILEVNDLEIPEWEEIMYKNLIRVERSKSIALVEPLVQSIYKKIAERGGGLILASLGSGSMEIERQVIEKVGKEIEPCLFIGIDISPTSKQVAKNNLAGLGDKIEIIEKDNIGYEFLQEAKAKLKKHTVVLANNDIFDLEKNFPAKSIDLIYSCLFRHHLNKASRNRLNDLYTKWASSVLEYDGFRSWINMIPQTIVGWNEPVFLNSEIFSNLRFPQKRFVRDILPGSKIRYFTNGYYLLEYNHEFGK
ncbi:MAG: hypothetical protein WC385_00425 [Candidatus Paceibacterota bacterium]|jgi:hypothetical protein